ncbi:uncharacterized protein HMPREF1541_08270 [Cyphellophora europaea CBS 101466]|uniref:Protein phosphatase n=1 Tax=Cyphellophora europaea (strain CBS 101466) TaxID=1220924 RepID=W2RNH1_CYPE1|nr:uncharacterized protein HMPREF1541_08270 [Cyphellophora europaea CBS 101466]ETN37279.1 hypothetical protein HMPREF1541_08270 [Cyphellophora europaea CBS 101466]
MSAAVANVRRHSVFLTRSLLLSNPPNRAGKPIRTDVTRAYRVFTDLSSSIRRSSSPYRVSTSTSHVPARAFSSSSHASSSPSSTSIPHISLHIAASSSGKGRRFRPDANTQEFSASSGQSLGAQRGSSLQEKRRSRPDSGQDAYFVAPVGSHSHSTTPQSTAFAIADGVGGWTDRGIDPADFSHGLCTYMSSLAQSFNASDSEPSLSPKRLLARGYQQLINDPDMVGGGTTACVGVIDPSGRMRIANLGDSGFVQLRLGRVQHLSEPQTHAFNTPYQLSLTPPEILRQAHIFGGVPIDDKPGSAEDFDLGISHGDVLVLATDGVWDNLDAQDLLKIVGGIMRGSGAWELHGEHGEQGFAVSDHIRDLVSREKGSKESQMPETLQGILAATIVGEAKNASLNEKRDGPFAKALRKYYPEEGWRGGKVDDIAVLVIVGVEEGGEANLKAKL